MRAHALKLAMIGAAGPTSDKCGSTLSGCGSLEKGAILPDYWTQAWSYAIYAIL